MEGFDARAQAEYFAETAKAVQDGPCYVCLCPGRRINPGMGFLGEPYLCRVCMRDLIDFAGRNNLDGLSFFPAVYGR